MAVGCLNLVEDWGLRAKLITPDLSPLHKVCHIVVCGLSLYIVYSRELGKLKGAKPNY
jgi:hypothetical protein